MEEPDRFSDQLERWLTDADVKTLGGLSEAFEEKSFAVLILLLMILPATPLPTGGITHVFEAITVVLAAQMVVGRRTVWLPRRWRDRELGDAITGKAVPFIVRRIRWFEQFSRPRGAHLLELRPTICGLGLVVMAFAIAAALAPPFSGLDTLPAMGAVLVALAMILEDLVVLVIGAVLGSAGILLIVTLGAALVRLVGGWL